MRKVDPFPVAIALNFVLSIFYMVCVGVHLLVGGGAWRMYRMWEMILPGFEWITWGGFFIGLTEIFVGGFYIAYTLIPLYNFFEARFPRHAVQPPIGDVTKPVAQRTV